MVSNNVLASFQCRTVKITIFGDEGVPVQVDGEAWVQPPGIIKIVHKNRAQMLTRDRVCIFNFNFNCVCVEGAVVRVSVGPIQARSPVLTPRSWSYKWL